MVRESQYAQLDGVLLNHEEKFIYEVREKLNQSFWDNNKHGQGYSVFLFYTYFISDNPSPECLRHKQIWINAAYRKVMML